MELRQSERSRQIETWKAARARLNAPREITMRPTPRPFQPSFKIVRDRDGAELVKPLVEELLPEPVAEIVVHNPIKGQLRLLLEEVAEKHGITPADMRCSRRFPRLSVARKEYFYRACAETDHSLPAIGRVCGGRDHTTALWGIISYCVIQKLPLPRNMARSISSTKIQAAQALRAAQEGA